VIAPDTAAAPVTMADLPEIPASMRIATSSRL
jgi:hypothetical protein